MEEYLDLVRTVLEEGAFKQNRTGVATISSFSCEYSIDLSDGFPLLTTKKLDGYRWDSLIYELLWYLSGEEHIRNLRENTKIWDSWADEQGRLDTAYGRFWRRYPIPDTEMQLDGESWPKNSHRWVNDDGNTFDQIQYVLDTLQNNPNSRRIVINAWHPANAAVSTLPPCHYTFVFNVQNDELNTHLTQRSGDIALGIPFNIAAYSILTKIIAKQTEFKLGTFSHSIVDAHIYCGTDKRAKWYGKNISTLQETLKNNGLMKTQEYVKTNPASNTENYDHVPNLLKQLSREPFERPTLTIADKSIEDLKFDDIQLHDYTSHDSLSFGVAE